MKRLGYILMSIFCAGAVCSCEKVQSDSGKELYFQVANYVTKAQSAYPTSDSFGMYSFFTPGEWAASGDAWNTYPYMNNLKISYNTATVQGTESTRWRPVDAEGNATPYYWPKAGKLNFISYSPYKASNSNIDYVKDSDGLKIRFKDCTISPSAGQEDLMYSDFVSNQTSSGTNGVPILFHHALAKVQFKFKTGEGTTIKPGSLTAVINNIGTKGSYLAGQTVSSAPIWTASNPAVNADFTVAPEGSGTQYSSASYVDGPQWYVMPQELKVGQQLQVACTFTVPMTDLDGNSFDVEIPFEKTIDLREIRESYDPAAKYYWNVNTIYIYNVTLSKVQHEIKFSLTATDWTTGAEVNLQ